MRATVRVMMMLLVATIVLAACGSERPDVGADPTTTTVPAQRGPFFGICGGLTTEDVAAATGFRGLRLAVMNTSSCEWLSGANYFKGAVVSFNWYRGSPIDRERGGVQLTKDNLADWEIDGHRGFIAHTGGRVCEMGVAFGADFIEVSGRIPARGENSIGIEKLCAGLKSLTATTITRARR